MKRTKRLKGSKKVAASGVQQRQRGRERVMTGRVQISVELVPVPMDASGYTAGHGRKEPNHNPVLPKPMGRIQWSLNPCRMLYEILGPTICKWLLCAICMSLSMAAFATIGEGVFANMITPSDARLKRDIVPIGLRSPRGAPLYLYRYKDSRHG